MATARAEAVQAAAARLMERCARLAKITETPGELMRTFLSPAMDEVHRTIWPWMEAAGMTGTVDRAGNLHELWGAADAPRLVIGSHLDTVPNAGAYDGVLGVLMGLALVELSAEQDYGFSIEVVGFSDEEGTRFGIPFLGSRAVVDDMSEPLLANLDENGVSVADALRDFAMRPNVVDARLSRHCAAYLEFHIEQGPLLEHRNLPLGIVEGLSGQSRCLIEFRGAAGHAGTSPMRLRRDALAGAAEWMVTTEAIATNCENAVATVGRILVEPGGVNVIPGLVRCTLDARHPDDTIHSHLVRDILNAAQAIADKRRLQIHIERYHEQAAVRFDAKLVGLAERAAIRAGHATMRMTGGAGHDAMVMAAHVPTVMMFLRNPGGVSHHPDESVAEEDVATAIDAGLYFLEAFASMVCGREVGKHA
jgi:allantoate deiminase